MLIISFSDLEPDPRVNRQIRFLKERYRVVAVGTAPPNEPGVEFVGVEYRAKSFAGKFLSLCQIVGRDYDGYYWRQGHIVDLVSRLRDVNADVVIANDIDALPVALRVANGAKVIFDAHEYAPLEWEDLLSFRLFHQRYRMHLCRRYIPQVDAMMTVCQSIADTYERDTGVRSEIVTNAPDYEVLEPSEIADDAAPIRLVHHGGAGPSRKLELMIQMMDHLDERFHLDFLLVGGGAGYLDALKRAAAANPRIRFLDPVPMRELPRFLNRYDIGIFLLPPTNFNYRFALPNKLFEFIQARLAVAVGPSPEMARVVRENDCGIVATDFTPDALAAALQGLDRQAIRYYKHRSHAIARELSADTNRETILRLVAQALAR